MGCHKYCSVYRIWRSNDGVIFLEKLGEHLLRLLQVVLLQLRVGSLGEKLGVRQVLEAFEEVDVGATAAPEAGHVGAGVEGSRLSTHGIRTSEVENVLGHLVHGGPVLLTGHTLTLEPVLLLQPGHAVILRAVEEDRTVVLTDLIALTFQNIIQLRGYDVMI